MLNDLHSHQIKIQLKHDWGGVKTEYRGMDKQSTNLEEVQDVIVYLTPVNLQGIVTKYIE